MASPAHHWVLLSLTSDEQKDSYLRGENLIIVVCTACYLLLRFVMMYSVHLFFICECIAWSKHVMMSMYAYFIHYLWCVETPSLSNCFAIYKWLLHRLIMMSIWTRPFALRVGEGQVCCHLIAHFWNFLLLSHFSYDGNVALSSAWIFVILNLECMADIAPGKK